MKAFSRIEKTDNGKKANNQNEVQKWQPKNAAEYLFSNDKGEMVNDLDASEVDKLYGGYMDALVGSYDKLKGRFNTFAAKCLSEK